VYCAQGFNASCSAEFNKNKLSYSVTCIDCCRVQWRDLLHQDAENYSRNPADISRGLVGCRPEESIRNEGVIFCGRGQ